eukprot:3935597-Rhodomonas_salina.3
MKPVEVRVEVPIIQVSQPLRDQTQNPSVSALSVPQKRTFEFDFAGHGRTEASALSVSMCCHTDERIWRYEHGYSRYEYGYSRYEYGYSASSAILMRAFRATHWRAWHGGARRRWCTWRRLKRKRSKRRRCQWSTKCPSKSRRRSRAHSLSHVPCAARY